MNHVEKTRLAQWCAALAALIEDQTLDASRRLSVAAAELRCWEASAKGEEFLSITQSLEAGAALVLDRHATMRQLDSNSSMTRLLAWCRSKPIGKGVAGMRVIYNGPHVVVDLDSWVPDKSLAGGDCRRIASGDSWDAVISDLESKGYRVP